MTFNPLEQAGIPLEEQFRNWSELNVTPYDKSTVDPYTRTRVILMNGIEVESIIFSHQFARHTDHPELKRALATNRRVDAQQQKAVNGLNPGDQNPLETTVGYEQVAVDLTAWLARHEPDPMVKQALDFALLEDFDHLYRYSNLYDLLYGGHADEITQHLTEITPGRPTIAEHRHPHDEVRTHFETHSVDPLTRMHVMTITAAEQQTMNFYMNHGTDWIEPIARGLYAEIALIEEQHVTHYESLLDPLDSWMAMWVAHEYNEVYMYWSMLQHESDRRIKALWELHLNMELGQLQVACDFMRRLEGREPAEMLPRTLPDTPVTFEPNKDYVRQVLAEQVDLRADGTDYVPLDELPAGHRYFTYQDTVNEGGAPSEQVIDETRAQKKREYHDETEGENPVPDLRESHGHTPLITQTRGDLMPTLIPTADTGARAVPVGLTHVDPAQVLLPTEHESFLGGTGLNGPFVADLLSDMTAHERGGVALYRSVGGRTNNPVLKQKYSHFENQTVEHVDVLETLVARLGGDPGYVSPSARATEKAGLNLIESTFMLGGSVDLMTQELVMLDAVLLAEAKDHANWSGLSQLVDVMPEGEVREAVREAVARVEPEEDEHFGWAQDMRTKLISAQVRSGAVQSMTAKAEEMVARVQGLFS